MTTLKVSFLSKGYFTLTASRPDISAAIALGSGAIVIGEQAVYEIVDETVAAIRSCSQRSFPREEENVSGS